MIAFVFGLGLMALTIGFISGLSSSPVVAVLLPLLFALATAGGNLYVVFGKEATVEKTGPYLSEVSSVYFLSSFFRGFGWVLRSRLILRCFGKQAPLQVSIAIMSPKIQSLRLY